MTKIIIALLFTPFSIFSQTIVDVQNNTVSPLGVEIWSNTNFYSAQSTAHIGLQRRQYRTYSTGTGNDQTDKVGIWIKGYYQNAGGSMPIYLGGDGYNSEDFKMVVENNGNVGIGVNSAIQKFQVAGSSAIDGTLIVGDPQVAANNKNLTLEFNKQNEYASIMSANWSGGYRSILFNKDATTDPFGVGIAIDGNPDSRLQVKGAGVTSSTASFHAVNYGGVSLMYVRDDGNVGIGTTTPQAKLAVNGDIFGKKLKVTQTGWPDYVFNRNYDLLPLSSLEKFIQINKHLPEIPSASEIEKDGLDVGENQAALLRKIEELTLYIIDLNKRLEKFENQAKETLKNK